jgi:hypothetical protein
VLVKRNFFSAILNFLLIVDKHLILRGGGSSIVESFLIRL